MKVWKGWEMEGPEKDIMTLFVKDQHVSGSYIADMLSENPECKRLYLGAGKTNVIKLWPIDEPKLALSDYRHLLSYCKKNEIKIILECSLYGIKGVPDIIWEECDQHIVRIEDKNLADMSSDDLIKLEYDNKVIVLPMETGIFTDITELKDNMFPSTDILLWSDEEGK